MTFLRGGIAAAVIIGGVFVGSQSFAMPVGDLGSMMRPEAGHSLALQQVYWRRWGWGRPWGWGGYGWRRPGWGYGWGRPWGYGYGWGRPWGYGYGWGRPWGWGYGWRYRHLLGSPAR